MSTRKKLHFFIAQNTHRYDVRRRHAINFTAPKSHTSNPSARKHFKCASINPSHAPLSSPCITTHSSRAFFVVGHAQHIFLGVPSSFNGAPFGARLISGLDGVDPIARTRAPRTEHRAHGSTVDEDECASRCDVIRPSHRDARPRIRRSGVRAPRDAHRAVAVIVFVSRRSTPPRLRARSDRVVAMDGSDDDDA